MIDASAAGNLHRFEHRAMACLFEVIIAGQEKEYAGQAADAAFEEVDRLEQDLSRFIGHSDISKVNALRPGEWVRLGPAALDCLLLAKEVWADTGGAFDVTVGALLHGAKEAAEPPTQVGMTVLEISSEHRAAGLRAGRVSVDLGAVGKGYALDQIARLLGDWGISQGIVHSGQSTALAIGAESWPLAIRDPEDHDAVLFRVSLPGGQALSGSGVKLHGHHIIDPRTGQPVTSRLGTWAIAPTAALSDAISTAFMVMSPDEIETYCAQHSDVGGMTLAWEGDDRISRTFGAWELLQIPSPPV